MNHNHKVRISTDPEFNIIWHLKYNFLNKAHVIYLNFNKLNI